MKIRAHVFISGRVQGVLFRGRTMQEAVRLNVTGWVRNLPDGRVEAVFEGEKKVVDEMLDFCREGPRDAVVLGVDVSWDSFKGEFKDFKIRH
ncbi:MAG TPA: acylphosphatase [Candidatus Nanoarchaeia archaeon]|nr:acylphosphatase [Candidatus Nanoarchaeia archaeon]